MLDFICSHTILWVLLMIVLVAVPIFFIGALLGSLGAPVWVCALVGMFIGCKMFN